MYQQCLDFRAARIVITGFVITTLVCSLSPGSAVARCSCGPDFCQGDSRIAQRLRDKKARLKTSGYPSRLVSLVDRGEQCVARIDRSPDIFTLLIIHTNGDKETVPWDETNERNVARKVASGELARYWIVHGRRAFSCCEQPSYEQMPDYDEDDDVNTSLAIMCTKSAPCP